MGLGQRPKGRGLMFNRLTHSLPSQFPQKRARFTPPDFPSVSGGVLTTNFFEERRAIIEKDGWGTSSFVF